MLSILFNLLIIMAIICVVMGIIMMLGMILDMLSSYIYIYGTRSVFLVIVIGVTVFAILFLILSMFI